MIVVPSFMPRSGREASEFLGRLSGRETPVELRVDGIRSPRVASLLAGRRPPLIVTCRRRAEGGRFDGSAREVSAILLEAIASGAEFIDAECSLGPAILRKLFDAAGRKRIVLSYHNPVRTPADLLERFRRMAAMRPAIVKIAVMARSVADTVPVLEVLAEARSLRQDVTAIAMGEFGVFTRVLQGVLGGTWTYASCDDCGPTAPGQISEGELQELYRAGDLNARTRIFGLVGNPVTYSRGRYYHNAVFSRKKANAVYVGFAADDAGEFMRTFAPRCAGLSVTMPFKKAIARHLDILEGSSLLTGSVNTVLRHSGKLTGLNTDFHAFLPLLRRGARAAGVRVPGARMLVLGTGATAATAVAAGVISGAKVTIAGRRPRRARELARRFGAGWIPLGEQRSFRAEILVNATPVGMRPRAGSGRPERIVAAPTLGNYRLVCDFANPPSGRTALVEDALRRRRKVVTGADIFAAQARLQSRLFLTLL
jgi:3-dehydroquinate dehydratase/shikimate dehydrogenase